MPQDPRFRRGGQLVPDDPARLLVDPEHAKLLAGAILPPVDRTLQLALEPMFLFADTAGVRKIRSPQITGLEWPRPGISVFQAIFSPVDVLHFTGSFPLSAAPRASAPRNDGQFSARAVIAISANKQTRITATLPLEPCAP